jgi:hypothetical protein
MKWLRLSAAVALVCVAALLIRLYQVHDQGWEWRLSASAAPPRILFDGRSYLRASEPALRVPSREVQQGRTPGGGVIFADDDSSLTQTVVWVETADDTFVYALQGGP